MSFTKVVENEKDIIKETIAEKIIPEQVKDLGEKSVYLNALRAKKTESEYTILSHQEIVAALDAKIVAIEEL